MELELTDDQRSLARHAIEAGRLQSKADAVIEAMALWEARERHRLELIASLEQARNEIVEGKGLALTPDSMRDLVSRVAERGRKRLDAERLTTS
jgi:Arc/MetJ-type ribon-helix-helix transcriptional regulator